MSDDPQDPDNLFPHRPAAQCGVVGGELLLDSILAFIKLHYSCCVLPWSACLGQIGQEGVPRRHGRLEGSLVVTFLQRGYLDTKVQERVSWVYNVNSSPNSWNRHSPVAPYCALCISGLVQLLLPYEPPPQTQEARTLRQMRLRSSGVEGSVPGVWGKV